MAQVIKTCPKILALLATFYPPGGEDPPSEAAVVDPDDVPEPYRRLLVHQRDMTSTLAAYHEDEIGLRVLDRVLGRETLARHVVLESRRTGRAVEYGASRIRLDAVDDQARRQILEGRIPLGGILKTLGFKYGNCPRGYFAVRSNDLIDRVFRLESPRWLFGRCNCLSDPHNRVIAEVVEVLPPEDT